MVKKIAKGVGALLLLLLMVGCGYVWTKTSAFDESMAKIYDVPVPDVTRSTDEEVIARGKHLTESIGACTAADCHGSDLSGGKVSDMGPLGTLVAPNITPSGLTADYSDGELYRLLRHAIRKDGRSVQFMPVHETNWLPEKDMLAIVSYLRTVPGVDKPSQASDFGILAKVLDQRGELVVDVARRIDHDAPPPEVPEPAPTKAYGMFVARNCTGCHGETLSGGPIPGAPPSLPIPSNITPDPSGIADYSYDDFRRLLDDGVKRDSTKLDPFMPYDALSKMNDVERRALWEYLRSVPPKAFGGR